MGDPSVSYEVIKKLMGTLQDLNENRYSLFANLELVKGQIREIVMPSKVSPVPNPYQVKASRAITIILDKDYSVYYYEGTHDPATGIDPVVTKTDLSLSGIHKYLANKNSDVIAKIQDLEKKKERNELSEADFEKQRKEIISDKSAPIVIIKATNASNLGNLVNILDEMGICNIGRYAIIDVTDYDKNLISKAGLLKQIPPPPPPPLQNQKEQKSQIKITPPPIFIEIKKEGVFLMKNLVTLDEFRKQLPLVVKNNPQSEVWINVKDKSNPDIQAVKNIVKEAGVSKWEYW
jgi:biopolymer transport protein ExbD